jgi:hypothetical protein
MTPHSNCYARHPKRGAVDPGQTLPAGKLFENSDVGAVNDQQETSAVQCTRLQNGWHAR